MIRRVGGLYLYWGLLARQLFSLALFRESLKLRQIRQMLHPLKALGGLDLHGRWQCFGVVQGGGLYIDYAGQHCFVAVEQTTAAVGAEAAHGGAG
mgnify:CR=1 FL=1